MSTTRTCGELPPSLPPSCFLSLSLARSLSLSRSLALSLARALSLSSPCCPVALPRLPPLLPSSLAEWLRSGTEHSFSLDVPASLRPVSLAVLKSALVVCC
eukprot:3200468-Rhodomonas_salina.3